VAQKDADGHDTDLRGPLLSMRTGALHEVPLRVSARPLESTAAQKDADAQETELRPPLPILTSILH
jgi:hypothetical protein